MTMDVEEARSIHQEQKKQSGEVARVKVGELNLPKAIETPEEIFGVGRKINKAYRVTRDELIIDFGEDLPKIMAAALHEYWFGCWNSAAFMQLCIDDKSVYDNDHTRKMATGSGYADIDGWANVLSESFSDLVPSDERISCIKELMDCDTLDFAVAHKCMAVYWLFQAAAEIQNGRLDTAGDLIHEAHEALASNSTFSTWDTAWSEATIDAPKKSASGARSELARKAGNAAHIETRALKAEVKVYWCDNISPTMGNDNAAEILKRQFPLELRTLSRYVSEFKKTAS